ncbi:hypothetical protein [Leptolyngbya sp. KIOST-1]|nr:hypothetical protein [Leptolyngbya sp. KIOST-1]
MKARNDDLEAQRLLFEELGWSEDWVVNGAEQEVLAFAMADGLN